MKVAVSIPDPIFAEADAMARRLGTTRSKLYARALEAYVSDNDPDRITDAINAVIDAVGDEPDEFVRASVNEQLRRVEW